MRAASHVLMIAATERASKTQYVQAGDQITAAAVELERLALLKDPSHAFGKELGYQGCS